MYTPRPGNFNCTKRKRERHSSCGGGAFFLILTSKLATSRWKPPRDRASERARETEREKRRRKVEGTASERKLEISRQTCRPLDAQCLPILASYHHRLRKHHTSRAFTSVLGWLSFKPSRLYTISRQRQCHRNKMAALATEPFKQLQEHAEKCTSWYVMYKYIPIINSHLPELQNKSCPKANQYQTPESLRV